jgi:hypothetical protein
MHPLLQQALYLGSLLWLAASSHTLMIAEADNDKKTRASGQFRVPRKLPLINLLFIIINLD